MPNPQISHWRGSISVTPLVRRSILAATADPTCIVCPWALLRRLSGHSSSATWPADTVRWPRAYSSDSTAESLALEFNLGMVYSSTSYYKKAGQSQTEVFANLTALLGSDSRFWQQAARAFYPRLSDLYMRIISDVTP